MFGSHDLANPDGSVLRDNDSVLCRHLGHVFLFSVALNVGTTLAKSIHLIA